MTYDRWFDTDENKVLLAICARKLIRNIGIGGIVWGIFNIAIGVFAVRVAMINAGILVLGLVMLGTGIHAMVRPTLGVLLGETAVAILLFLWNLAMAVINAKAGAPFDVRGLIFPLAIAVTFVQNYRKLQPVREHVLSVRPETLRATQQMCKTLLKKKLKTEPSVIQTSDGRCRAQLMADRAVFIRRDLQRAFVVPRDELLRAIVKPDAKALKLVFEHPLGRLKYGLDRKNSDKFRQWLAGTMPPPAPAQAPV
jgi:hypothetical protein